MIRNSYGKKHWTFPGGGKKKNETSAMGVKRETAEEIGISLEKSVYLGTYFSRRQHKRDTVYCFYSKIDNDQYKIDNDEIGEAGWFSLAEMPKFHSAAVEDVLGLYERYQTNLSFSNSPASLSESRRARIGE